LTGHVTRSGGGWRQRWRLGDAAEAAETTCRAVWRRRRSQSGSRWRAVPLRLDGLPATLSTVQRSVQASHTHSRSHRPQASPLHGIYDRLISPSLHTPYSTLAPYCLYMSTMLSTVR